MHEEPAGAVDRGARSEPDRARPRRLRLVPPAVTPIRTADLAAGAVDHWRGRGRDEFRRALESSLGATGSATYTSFRRALAGCLLELARTAPADRETVLVPAFCSPDFVAAIEGVGLEVARYDVDEATLAADTAAVADALQPSTLAVVAVNVLGYSSPMDELAELAGVSDAYLVEALGYALGSEYDGRRLGTFGDCAVLNFQQGKPVPVGGGMVLTQNAELSVDDAGRPAVGPNALALAGYAWLSRPRPYYVYTSVRDALAAAGYSAPATTHPEAKFDVGYTEPFATLSDFQGAVGRRVLGRLDEHRRQRRRTAEYYRSAFADCPNVRTLRPVDGLARLQYVRYPIRLRSAAVRDRVQSALAGAGIQATTLYDWPVIDRGRYPGAAALQRTILTLPTHPYVDEADRRRVVAVVREEAGSGGPADAQ